MKIYKIAAQQQFPMIGQNPDPRASLNNDANLQNLQQSQQAMQFLQNIIEVASELEAKVADLDDALGQSTGLGQIIQQKVQQSISQTPAWSIVTKMGLMTNPNDLSNANTMSLVNTRIQTQVNQAGQIAG